MAFKLNKAEQKIKDDYLNELKEKFEALREATDAYNATLYEVKGWVSDKVNEWEDEIGDRSEKWQESDRGGQVRQFIDDWSYFEPEEVELSDEDALDAFENLPIGPGEQ